MSSLVSPRPAAYESFAQPDAPTAHARPARAWWPGDPRWRLAIGALFALTVAACVATLTWPLGYDQGIFAAVGDVVVRGGQPYRDTHEQRGPMAFYVSAAIQLLFGRHEWGVRVFDLTVSAGTAAMLYRRVAALASPRTGVVAAISWPLLVIAFGQNVAAQFDLWVGSAALGAALLASRPGGARARDLLGAGALIGCATLVKPFYPVLLAAPGLAVLLRRPFTPKVAARGVALLAAGWLAPIVLMLAWLWSHGALGAMWQSHILFNLRFYAPSTSFSKVQADSPLRARLLGLAAALQWPNLVLALPLAAGGLGRLWRRDRALGGAAAALLVGGLLCVVAQGKFFLYHWSVMFPALLLTAAVGVHRLWTAGGDAGRAVAAFSVAALACWYAPNAARFVVWGLRYATGGWDTDRYLAAFTDVSEVYAPQRRAVAAYLRAHTRPDDAVAHWTNDAGLPFAAGRRAVGRLPNKVYVAFAPPGATTTSGLRDDFVARVARERPTYFVVDSRSISRPGATTPRGVLAAEAPALDSLVAARYVLEARISQAEIYRLRGAPAAAVPR